MSCNNCLPGQKEKDEDLIVMRSAAKDKAEQSRRAVAIIEEYGQLQLCDAEQAILNKYIVKEVVSHL